MPDLESLQAWLQSYVICDPKDREDLSNSSHTHERIDQHLKANDRLNAKERLDIYARMYQGRVYGALTVDFPGLKGALGDKRFLALIAAFCKEDVLYNNDLNTMAFNLRRYLDRQKKLRQKRLILDLAQYEASILESANAADPAPLVQAYAEDDFFAATVTFNASVRLIKTIFPLKDLRRHPEQAAELLKANDKHVRYYLLSRTGLFVDVNLISYGEYAVLSALRAGKTIAAALAEGLKRDATLTEDALPEILAAWFQSWTQRALFAEIRA